MALAKPLEGSEESELVHLQRVYKQTGQLPEKLANLPKPPAEWLYLWNWLGEFTHPLSFAELESWLRLSKKELAVWEIEVLTMLDRVRANV